MIKNFLFYIIVLIVFIPSNLFAKQAPFNKGETIRYVIKQFGVKIGEAELIFKGEEVLDGREVFLIVFNSKGIKFYDYELIYVDKENFRPIKVIRDLKIFGGVEKIVEYYKPNGEALIVKTVGDKTTQETVFRGGAVDNIYGFIYRYRMSSTFDDEQTFDVKLPTVDIKMSLGGKTSFVAAGKKYQSVVLTSVPSKYTLWIDQSEKRIPLRIAGSMGIANTVMTMIEYTQ